MSYILVIWTVVAATNWQGTTIYKDWRPLGEFKSETACIHAAHQIGLHGGERFRCIPTDTLPEKAKP